MSGSTGRPVGAVTGGASGLGRAIAEGLVRRGWDLLVVARDPARLASETERLRAIAPAARITGIATTDLAVRREMDRIAREVSVRTPRLDLLVNNAGGIFATRHETPDGLERTFALNVLAPFVLSYRLAPALAAGRSPRVVNVTSAAHRMQRLDLDDLQLRRHFSAYRAYGRSKLALLLLSREFARRWSGAGPEVFAVHPGLVATRFGQNNVGSLGTAFRLGLGLFGASADSGARSPLYAATDASLSGRSGSYIARSRIRSGSSASRDPVAARALFERCRALAGLDAEPLADSELLPR